MEANFTIQHILNSLLEFISYWTVPGSTAVGVGSIVVIMSAETVQKLFDPQFTAVVT